MSNQATEINKKWTHTVSPYLSSVLHRLEPVPRNSSYEDIREHSKESALLTIYASICFS